MVLPVRRVNCGSNVGDGEFASAPKRKKKMKKRGIWRKRKKKTTAATTRKTIVTMETAATSKSPYAFGARLFHGWTLQFPGANSNYVLLDPLRDSKSVRSAQLPEPYVIFSLFPQLFVLIPSVVMQYVMTHVLLYQSSILQPLLSSSRYADFYFCTFDDAAFEPEVLRWSSWTCNVLHWWEKCNLIAIIQNSRSCFSCFYIYVKGMWN